MYYLKNIEEQLDAKSISNERIAGANRQETSLKIAKKNS
ncbi:cell wall-binding repeat-containing protein [Clostridium sp. CCUG 7971]|nr:cell wall-binding repeat-containing protein [Clostridium sp. CCUG 7971]MBO3446493.1 cell wall-binding repeat-containing protein [Clostridium sp. CCUG 7971]